MNHFLIIGNESNMRYNFEESDRPAKEQYVDCNDFFFHLKRDPEILIP